MSNFYTEPFVSAGEMEFPSEPYITAQPQNHTATGPEEYVLKVIAAGAVSYQWEVFDGVSWSTIVGATSDTLTITIDSSMNGWRYRVLVTGADGSTVVSKAAQIAVKGVQEITLEGAIVTFTGPARITSLEAGINAVQDLHGQANPYPAGGGINQWDEEWELGTWGLNGTTIQRVSSSTQIRNKNLIAVQPSTTYCIRCGADTSGFFIVLIDDVDTMNGTIISRVSGSTYKTFTTRANTHFIGFSMASSYGTTYKNDISINYPSTDTSYHPYENICPISGWDEVDVVVSPTLDAEDGTTYPITLPSTCYGGKIKDGVLTVTHGYIASYNGETLPSTWISDRDVYAEGTTPTIGAEVVYELATPIEITLSDYPTITTLSGTNNLWADSGDISVTIVR